MNEPQNLPSAPADDAILWRYMSFTKFASLLTKRWTRKTGQLVKWESCS